MTKQVYIVRVGERGPGPGKVIGVFTSKRKAVTAILKLGTLEGPFVKVPDVGNVFHAGDMLWASWVPEPVDQLFAWKLDEYLMNPRANCIQ